MKRKESRSGFEPRALCLPAQRLTARPNRLTWRMYLWWNLCALYLLACQVKVTVQRPPCLPHKLKCSNRPCDELCCSGVNMLPPPHRHLVVGLHWLPVARRISYSETTCTAPSYLSDFLELYIPSRIHRSSADSCIFRISNRSKKFQGQLVFFAIGTISLSL